MASERRAKEAQKPTPENVATQPMPLVERRGERCRVTGTFYRAVSSAHRASALEGSRLPGRYSTAEQRTLYLSSSPEGVVAAMAAHGGVRDDLTVLQFDVHADGIVDLRDPAALEAAGVDLQDAVAPWQDTVSASGIPSSWRFRQRLETQGAAGLIDPSRTQSGLWHLVLFRWNTEGAAQVTPTQQGCTCAAPASSPNLDPLTPSLG